MQAIEYSGIWWLPTNPQTKVAGTLTFSNEDGIALELIGALGDLGTFNSRQPYPLILGLAGDGKKVTLSNCVFAGVTVGMPGFARESYMASFCLVGAHFNELDEVRFSRCEVSFSHLPDWVRTSGFAVKQYWDEHKVEVIYSLPPDVEAETSKGLISLSFICNTSGDGIEEMNLHQSVWMEVKADKEYAFHDLIYQFIRPLQNLLSLATTKPNSILELNVFSKRVFCEKEDGERVETPIQLCFQQKYFEPRLSKLLIPDYMLFTLHDIANNFQAVMERWFSISNELDSVCNLFFGIQYTPTLNLENKFLNTVQAVESYHRRRMKNEVLPKAEHERLKSAVLNKVDAEHRAWLKGLLAYATSRV
ncbi:MAG TPA: HEPN domain-containing protein [Pyrinomonadaceae bacterium]|nr:HEPN domain-containing protein [Pyrinomonadaceae bacterium]